MFRWYSRAARCYVYMSDVLHDDNTTQPFHESVWFTRGWTLQEFIAPSWVDFFDQRGQWIGSKFSLLHELVTITGVPKDVLLCKSFLKYFTTKNRLSWARRRVTTWEEDEAHCLLGISGVHMPMLYGEGLGNVRRWFNREIALRQNLFRIMQESLQDSFPRQVCSTTLYGTETFTK
jgi:hypothetical protein